MTYPTQDPVMITLMREFAYDPSVVVLDKLPFFDDFKQRRQIDYALITRAKNSVAIAILVKYANLPNNHEDLKRSVHILEQLNWITFVFTEDELLFHFSEVKAKLQNALQGMPCK